MSSSLGGTQLRGEGRWLWWNGPRRIWCCHFHTIFSLWIFYKICCLFLVGGCFLLFACLLACLLVCLFFCLFVAFQFFYAKSCVRWWFDVFFQLPVWYGSLCMFVPLKLESSTKYRTFWKFGNYLMDYPPVQLQVQYTDWVWLGPTWGRYVPQRCRKRSQRPPGAKPKVQTWRVSWLQWHWGLLLLDEYFNRSKDS